NRVVARGDRFDCRYTAPSTSTRYFRPACAVNDTATTIWSVPAQSTLPDCDTTATSTPGVCGPGGGCTKVATAADWVIVFPADAVDVAADVIVFRASSIARGGSDGATGDDAGVPFATATTGSESVSPFSDADGCTAYTMSMRDRPDAGAGPVGTFIGPSLPHRWRPPPDPPGVAHTPALTWYANPEVPWISGDDEPGSTPGPVNRPPSAFRTSAATVPRPDTTTGGAGSSTTASGRAPNERNRAM